MPLAPIGRRSNDSVRVIFAPIERIEIRYTAVIARIFV
jgi:hypothetical protein